MRTSKTFHFLIIFLFYVRGLTIPVRAQTPVTVTVNDEHVIEGSETLSLDVYFTLLEDGGQGIPQSATILLEDGSRYDARLEKSPYYMALVLDASGSMEAVIDEVRQAAIEAVDAAPANTHFAVIRFDERIDLLQPFTDDRDQVLRAINQVEVNDIGTCLYDVAYTAVQTLEQIAQSVPRRAMILFTDGRDEISQGSDDACSKNTYDQLVAFARDREVAVPIHTVGISDSPSGVNSDDLSNLSRATGGLSAIGDEAVLSELFRQIMSDVGNQWVVRAELRPTQGYHRGVLLLTLDDGRLPPPAPLTFTSSRNYVDLPEPILIDISNFTYNEIADVFFFDVLLTGYAQVDSLRIEVLDKQNNLQVYQSLYLQPLWLTQQIRLETNQLKAEREYIANVYPLSVSKNHIKDEAGDSLVAGYAFRYDPPRELVFNINGVQIEDEEPKLNIRTMQIEDDEARLILNLQIENGEQVARYEGFLINQAGNQQGDAFDLEVLSDGTAAVPFAVEAGVYRVVVNAMAEDGSRLANASYRFSYTPPHVPSVQAWQALQSNPILLVLVAVLLLIVILIVLWIGVAAGKRRGRVVTRSQADEQSAPKAKAGSTAPPVKLTVVASPDKSIMNGDGRQINRFPYTIGREGSDLAIVGDRHVSRKHAEITFNNGIFYIEDFGSSNGTFLNEARIAANEPAPLSADIGAKIRIGKTTHLAFQEIKAGSETETVT